jgi:hypothetical protein
MLTTFACISDFVDKIIGSFLRLDFPKPKLNLGSGKEKRNTTRSIIAQQTNSTSDSAGIRSFFNSTAPSAMEKRDDIEIPETSNTDEQEEYKENIV